jgi:hypothetical protein
MLDVISNSINEGYIMVLLCILGVVTLIVMIIYASYKIGKSITRYKEMKSKSLFADSITKDNYEIKTPEPVKPDDITVYQRNIRMIYDNEASYNEKLKTFYDTHGRVANDLVDVSIMDSKKDNY